MTPMNTVANRSFANSQSRSVRPGEGALIDLVAHTVSTVKGQTVQTFGLNMSAAPVPERKYYAQTCDVRLERHTVSLLFGQLKLGKTELRSLLVVQMSPSNASKLLSSIEEMEPSIQAMAQVGNIAPDTGVQILEEPPQTIAFAAALAMLAIANEDACMDFFQMSPFSLLSASHTKKVGLDPVVRVDLPASLLFGLVQKLQGMSSRLPSAFLEPDSGTDDAK